MSLDAISRRWRRIAPADRAITMLLAIPLTIFCALAWTRSFSWPLQHDLPIMLYMGWLIEHLHWIPHVDFFDMNSLGSYMGYGIIGRIFGFESVSLRFADLLLYLVLSASTLLVFRPIGRLAGWVGAALFGIVYLGSGSNQSLQREYLMLAPILLSVAAATNGAGRRVGLRRFLSGLAVGLASTIKPQVAIALVPLLWFYSDEVCNDAPESRDRWHPIWGVAGALLLGWALPIAVMIGALVASGALGAYREILTDYLPLYGAMGRYHEILLPADRPGYMLQNWIRLGSYHVLLVGAAYSVFLSLVDSRDIWQRRCVVLFIGMAVVFALYPLASGQFWRYHWLPFAHWLVLCLAWVVVAIERRATPNRFWLPLAITILLLFVALRPDRGIREHFASLPVESYPEQIADFLEARIQPGDRVQPLDWTDSGVLHGMLLARAEAATPFLYDFHFYHHVSTRYITELRERFIEELDASNARFVVRGNLGPFPSGRDTDRRFAQLEALLLRKYRRARVASAFTIYELRSSEAAGLR